VITTECARALSEVSRDLNRQVGILINRKGTIEYVIVGDHHQIVIPSLDGVRMASERLSGLRLAHTHLAGESLSRDDYTDLALLRLDFITAIAVGDDGLPGRTESAHLLPENPDGAYWTTLTHGSPAAMDIDFAAFIQALETEYARRQRTRPISATNRAILIHVATDPHEEGEESLVELAELARTAGVTVFDTIIQRRTRLDPRYVAGRGKLSALVIKALQQGANLLIFDHELTPAQVRSIADETDLKVIDRTQLILDIFAQRAHSRAGKLQVELAQLQYLLPRLITKNTAMSRLTGGIGGRGPGETKLEINRRRVRDRIGRLQRELDTLRKHRQTRRGRRRKRALPVVSIVGYTNAGKSTLLNTLTHSHVHAEDRLFATLDPKSSRLRFPRDTEAIITDTVGFIKDLPEELRDAFRSTLEELEEADVLIIVADAADPRCEDHLVTVGTILSDLGIDAVPAVTVFNKADLCADTASLANLCHRYDALSISALDESTLPPLATRLEDLLFQSCGGRGKTTRSRETPIRSL